MNNRCPLVSVRFDKRAALPAARHATVCRWRIFALAVVTLVGVLGQTSNVSAYYAWMWTSLGVGCARSIAVGPNGVPWILGCPGGNAEGTGPAWVYYLSSSRPPGSLFPVYQWNYDNFSALTLSINLSGNAFATDANGEVYADASNNATGDMPG